MASKGSPGSCAVAHSTQRGLQDQNQAVRRPKPCHMLCAAAATDVARRLSLLLSPEAAAATASSTAQPEWYDPAFVLQQYESLAEMCLSQRAVQQADVVLESAEVAGLQPSAAVLAKLTAALRGQPRRGEVRETCVFGCCGVRAGTGALWSCLCLSCLCACPSLLCLVCLCMCVRWGRGGVWGEVSRREGACSVRLS